ncbi:hypothetical protein SAMN05216338_102598 [Bradyrhizobium sp. Rc2d]|uniref:hypothetical protein n=1 Tax=Bradyrhizobium sp. Rc2d TaxID=1855321 RepID=UPI0008901F5B|nr:hypothetical protein [Bradyrhizobium sp. Rc2d]SDI57862.1 hypothetical protein SAMN05216338_102598 [Bradyrhizobium sp. Rc2d]
MTIHLTNYRRFPRCEKERILQQLDRDSGQSEALIRGVAKDNFGNMERAESAVMFMADVLQEHWERCGEVPWPRETLASLLTAIQEEVWEEKQAAGERLAVARRQADLARKMAVAEEAAQKRATEETRKRDAEATKRVASEFGITTRQARNLRVEGTVNPRKAEQLAIILGTEPAAHLRRRRRRGINLVKLFADVKIEDARFCRFLSDEDIGRDTNALIDFFKNNQGRIGIWEPESLEDVVHQARLLRFPHCSLDLAEEAWKSFQIWRIETICRTALYDIQF